MMKSIAFTTKRTLYLLTTLTVVLLSPKIAFAQEDDDPIGTIIKPDAVRNFDTAGNVGEGEIGILSFMSTMITYMTVVAGVWAIVNLLLAGYTYVTSSGNSQTHTKVRDRLTMTVLGLVLMVTVYAVAAILGTIFFGNSLYFLNPEIQGPGTP